MESQYLRNSGLCVFGFPTFFPFGTDVERHNMQRASLQHWQKSQSGQGYFFFGSLFSISVL